MQLGSTYKCLRSCDIMTQSLYLFPTKIIFSFLFYSIEHCIKEIQSEVNKQCPDVQLQTTTDCIEWLDNYNYNSSKSPSIPCGDLIKFLKTLVKKKKESLFYSEVGWVNRNIIHSASICKYFSDHVILPYLGVGLLFDFVLFLYPQSYLFLPFTVICINKMKFYINGDSTL